MSRILERTRNLRLLDSPWNSEEKSWNGTALEKAKKTVDQWESRYPLFKRRVFHTDPNQAPKLPTFTKVDESLIAPMLTLGGKFLTSSENTSSLI